MEAAWQIMSPGCLHVVTEGEKVDAAHLKSQRLNGGQGTLPTELKAACHDIYFFFRGLKWKGLPGSDFSLLWEAETR